MHGREYRVLIKQINNKYEMYWFQVFLYYKTIRVHAYGTRTPNLVFAGSDTLKLLRYIYMNSEHAYVLTHITKESPKLQRKWNFGRYCRYY